MDRISSLFTRSIWPYIKFSLPLTGVGLISGIRLALRRYVSGIRPDTEFSILFGTKAPYLVHPYFIL